MPAGEDFRVLVLGQQIQCLIKCIDANVIKCGRNHDGLPLISCQTFSGRTGMSMCFTPYGDNASTTAFTTAGVAPIVPASPTPFTPSGLTGEGVSVRSVSNQGICEAFGSA